MKKIILTLLTLAFLPLFASAVEVTEESVAAFFDSYVKAANNFEDNIFEKYYIANPTIYRVVEKKDGTTERVQVPVSTYKKEAGKGRALGKMIRYTNEYTNRKYTKVGNDIRVDAVRVPSPGGKYKAYFVIGKDSAGNLKIKVESMNTPRQEFLKK